MVVMHFKGIRVTPVLDCALCISFGIILLSGIEAMTIDNERQLDFVDFGLRDVTISTDLLASEPAPSAVSCATRCTAWYRGQNCSVVSFRPDTAQGLTGAGTCRFHARPVTAGSAGTLQATAGYVIYAILGDQEEACPGNITKIPNAMSVTWGSRSLWSLSATVTGCLDDHVTSSWDDLVTCTNGLWTGACNRAVYYKVPERVNCLIPRLPVLLGHKICVDGFMYGATAVLGRMASQFVEQPVDFYPLLFVDLRTKSMVQGPSGGNQTFGNATQAYTRRPIDGSYGPVTIVNSISPFPLLTGRNFTAIWQIVSQTVLQLDLIGEFTNYTANFTYERNLLDLVGMRYYGGVNVSIDLWCQR